jgi:preprotein translocase subunit SecY
VCSPCGLGPRTSGATLAARRENPRSPSGRRHGVLPVRGVRTIDRHHGPIIFFSFFYVSVQYDPYDQADNMKKYGGFIPGIRPGRPTAEYLGYVMNRLLVVGSIYLGLIAILPNILINMGVQTSASANGSMPFGGTAILILVSVALTTVKQIESQVMQANYEGFLK